MAATGVEKVLQEVSIYRCRSKGKTLAVADLIVRRYQDGRSRLVTDKTWLGGRFGDGAQVPDVLQGHVEIYAAWGANDMIRAG